MLSDVLWVNEYDEIDCDERCERCILNHSCNGGDTPDEYYNNYEYDEWCRDEMKFVLEEDDLPF